MTTWRRRAGRATSITVALALATTIGAGHGSARGAGRGAGSDSAAPGFATTTLELASQDAEALGHATTRALAHGGELVATGPGVALVELAPTAWPAVAAVAGVELRRPVPVDIRPERTSGPEFGPVTAESIAITGADAWHTAGIDGNGVRIGVIDFFDTRYWDPAEHGPLPQAGVNARCFAEGADCTADFFDGEDLGGEDHGVAVVEIIRDMAPGAEILLGQAETLADYELLVDWFVSQGVRVISRSLGSRYDGPGDGRGALNEVASQAVSRGITWINSGGNNAVGQYYRHAVRLIGSRVAFGPVGTETYLPLRGCIELGGMRWANDWDRPPAERTDYDLYVWDSPTGSPASGEVIGISQRRQTDGATPIEVVAGTYCPPTGRTLYLEVRWLGGDVTGDVLEILDYGNGFTQHTQAEYSAAVSIVDADVAGVVSVGAIDPPDSGTIGIYSSRGPTNDGRVAPQVTAPAGVSSTVYDGRFSGTSAAAPVVAGAAALFLDAELAGDAASLGDLVRHSTVDRGDPGPDNTYGHGELRLPAPPPPVTQTPSRYVPLAAPTRALDTRPESPVGPAALIGSTRAGEVRPLPIAGTAGVPVTATSVAVNIVTVAPDRRSFVQALPLWQSTLGGYSNLNTDGAAQNRANFAIVPIAADGTIALYSTAAGHLVVDVLGWFEPVDGAVTAGRFVALPSAQRLLDTRDGAAPVPSGTTLAVPDPTGIVTDEVEALVVTVTAVRPSSVGWLQAFPAARPDVVGTTSTVNTAPGSNAASTAIVPIAPAGEGVAVHTSFAGGGTGHVVVDAIGYFTSATAASSTAGRFVPLRPVRAFDSRLSGGPLLDGQTVVVDATGADVPIDARGVMWNLTVVNATRHGYATGWAASAPQPATSSLNWSLPGEVRAAAAVTAVSDGAARFRLDDQGAPEPGPLGHLLVDVFGYFT